MRQGQSEAVDSPAHATENQATVRIAFSTPTSTCGFAFGFLAYNPNRHDYNKTTHARVAPQEGVLESTGDRHKPMAASGILTASPNIL